MNGIIHNCTHKDSDSPTFRMTEDKMFITIFNYIEHLFGKIKPRKLFFMAIDGVAPRAKMNQQRARRFRTALDAEKAREKAIKEGQEMPTEDPFDSNCITPGTEFMAKLTQQLKYFISKKVSEDTDWQGVEVVLSGHEVPGEGEHKIMEYIRQAKAQPNYDPNVRHCLYGLDADLIMLGLLSHDPHFCLLREEVTFGRQSKTKSKDLEHQNFYLMHLCIVREYLELEFQELKQDGAFGFPYDLERVIDDFILMAFFVGNDFLPNLPNLHINEGALALMFQKYKEILPRLGGYINEHGYINLDRLAILLDALSEVEYRFFEAEYSDAKWIKSKQNQDNEEIEPRKGKAVVRVTPLQKALFRDIKKFVISPASKESKQPFDCATTLPARDRKFVQQLAVDLNLEWKTVQTDDGERFIRLEFPSSQDQDDDSDDEEGQLALMRVLKRYENAKVEDVSAEANQAELQKHYDQKFVQWKDKYYTEKFEWGLNDEEPLRGLTENYVQGLQWVLFYYYRGVASWPWYYKYHYSPMISDVKKGLKANMEFKLGQPFRPFQQLMGVLPDRSKKIVPSAYHDLMSSPDSPIIDFYPRDFELDMNGKKMDWEAVIKIPFINEERLLNAMKTKDRLLTSDEKSRNDFGVSLKFTYSPEVEYTYPSSLVGVFPDLPFCHCVQNVFDLPTMEGLEPYVGLVDGVKVGAAALAGFPSLKTLNHVGSLGFHGVNVFQSESRNESMVVTLVDSETLTSVEHGKLKLGQRVHVGYPLLQEAEVEKVSDELFDYTLSETEPFQVIATPHNDKEIEQWHKKAERIEQFYSKRLGMIIGSVESTISVKMLKGLKKMDDGSLIKEFVETPGIETIHATQLVVDKVISEDERFIERAALPIGEEFPIGARAFFLGDYAYGRPLTVTGSQNNKAQCLISITKARQYEFGRDIARQAEKSCPYIPSYAVARNLQLNPLALSKLTSSFRVRLDDQRVDLGLNIKFDAKKLKVLGYTRRGQSGWEFSQKAINILQQYMIKFPQFIAGVNRNPHADVADVSEYYPGEDCKAKIKEIQAWLKEIDVKNFEKVPYEAEQLDSEAVKQIEQAADALIRSEPPAAAQTMNGIPRSALLKPSDAEQRLGDQTFHIGDRVIYAADSGKVPIASRGTVVGLTTTSRTTLLDVIFDSSFMSGTTLGDRCSPFRGQTVASWTVLNLTDRQVIAFSKAGSSRQTAAKTTSPLTVPAYGMPTGPNGQGQLVEAGAPPPLQGSFRGAVAGQTKNTRGNNIARGNGRSRANGSLPFRNSSRGGGEMNGRGGQQTRGGYTPLDRGDQLDGVVDRNPNFKPRSHQNVPPPASLDNTSIKRGRGGSRGRGDNGNNSRGRAGQYRPRGTAAV